jgi:hypothetical protein
LQSPWSDADLANELEGLTFLSRKMVLILKMQFGWQEKGPADSGWPRGFVERD